jgi:hypothetical protein
MKRKNKNKPAQIQKNVLRLADNHTWKAPKGYKIVMADRGAVSFNIPENWHVAKFEPLELLDGEPPNDNARVSMSYWRLPEGIDWSRLPLAEMLAESTKDHPHKIIARGELVTATRDDIEIVWTEHRFEDPQENREAYSRFALARGWNVQALVTFDFWVEDLEKSKPVWDEILRSLQLGRSIQDPTKGAILH